MSEKVIQIAREFLVSYVKGKDNFYEDLHPRRKGWEFVILHSFRVGAYALKIIEEDAMDFIKRA